MGHVGHVATLMLFAACMWVGKPPRVDFTSQRHSLSFLEAVGRPVLLWVHKCAVALLIRTLPYPLNKHGPPVVPGAGCPAVAG